MENHVTYDMAIALKEAGFPQPEPKDGQFWYVNGARYVVTSGKDDEYGLVSLAELGEMGVFTRIEVALFAGTHPEPFPQMIFAPNAQDILKAFHSRFGVSLKLRCNDSMWMCEDTTESLVDDTGKTVMYTNVNPADAAARCFLMNPLKRGAEALDPRIIHLTTEGTLSDDEIKTLNKITAHFYEKRQAKP